jgi:hypothetical protein
MDETSSLRIVAWGLRRGEPISWLFRLVLGFEFDRFEAL